jgi:hypothetical protein
MSVSVTTRLIHDGFLYEPGSKLTGLPKEKEDELVERGVASRGRAKAEASVPQPEPASPPAELEPEASVPQPKRKRASTRKTGSKK